MLVPDKFVSGRADVAYSTDLPTLLTLARAGAEWMFADEEAVTEKTALAICRAGKQEAGFMGISAEDAWEEETAPMPCAHSCVACRNVARAAIAAMKP